MTISGERLLGLVPLIKFPVDILYVSGDTVAIEQADRELVERLIGEDALAARANRNEVKSLRLTKKLSDLVTTIRKVQLPIADDSRTTFREELGDGRFVFQHSMPRCAAYARAA